MARWPKKRPRVETETRTANPTVGNPAHATPPPLPIPLPLLPLIPKLCHQASATNAPRTGPAPRPNHITASSAPVPSTRSRGGRREQTRQRALANRREKAGDSCGSGGGFTGGLRGDDVGTEAEAEEGAEAERRETVWVRAVGIGSSHSHSPTNDLLPTARVPTPFSTSPLPSSPQSLQSSLQSSLHSSLSSRRRGGRRGSGTRAVR